MRTSQGMVKASASLAMVTVAICIAIQCADPATAIGHRIVRQLSKAGDVSTYPDIAFLPRGRAIATWVELGRDNKYTVMVSEMAERRAGWSKATALSGEMNLATQPAIATTSTGAAVVAWYGETSTGDYVATSSQVSPRAGWSPVLDLSGVNAGGVPTVAADGADEAIVAWSTGVQPSQVRAAEFNLVTRHVASAVVLQRSSAPLLRVSAAADRSGGAVVAWERYKAGSALGASGITNTIEVATQASRGARWASPVQLGTEYEPSGENSATTHLPGPSVALASDGRIAVCWQGLSHGLTVPETDFGSTGSGWPHPEVASHRSALNPQVAVGRYGSATVVWEHNGSVEVDATRWGTRWPRAKTLQKNGRSGSSGLQIAENARGQAVASWSGGTAEVVARRLSGRWRRPQRLGSGGVARVAIDGHGDAAIAWQRPTVRPRGISIVAADLRV